MTRHNSGPQKCDQCDKNFLHEIALKSHIRLVHCEPKLELYITNLHFRHMKIFIADSNHRKVLTTT